MITAGDAAILRVVVEPRGRRAVGGEHQAVQGIIAIEPLAHPAEVAVAVMARGKLPDLDILIQVVHGVARDDAVLIRLHAVETHSAGFAPWLRVRAKGRTAVSDFSHGVLWLLLSPRLAPVAPQKGKR